MELNVSKERMDWFHFETKSRQATQKLIQPILDQMTEDKNMFMNLAKDSHNHEERLKLLEYVVFESGNRQTMSKNGGKEQAKLVQQMGILEHSLKQTTDIFDIVKGEIDTIKTRNEIISRNQDGVSENLFKIRETLNQK